MKCYVALLRAVNVGGTGKLAMSDLKRTCEEAGFENVRTYIASGNVVFGSAWAEKKVKAELEKRLEDLCGKKIDVLVRTADELLRVLKGNPFKERDGKFTLAIFLDQAPPKDALETVRDRSADEVVRLGEREIYVYYGSGMGRSKLKIPAAKAGTARNMNTVAKLAEMAGEI